MDGKMDGKVQQLLSFLRGFVYFLEANLHGPTVDEENHAGQIEGPPDLIRRPVISETTWAFFKEANLKHLLPNISPKKSR